jgi:hypothetical protein
MAESFLMSSRLVLNIYSHYLLFRLFCANTSSEATVWTMSVTISWTSRRRTLSPIKFRNSS